MDREDFARELMLDEINREKGRFVTLRIIDRMVVRYGSLFDRRMLTAVADRINGEFAVGRTI
jgi:hypothetical protein